MHSTFTWGSNIHSNFNFVSITSFCNCLFKKLQTFSKIWICQSLFVRNGNASLRFKWIKKPKKVKRLSTFFVVLEIWSKTTFISNSSSWKKYYKSTVPLFLLKNLNYNLNDKIQLHWAFLRRSRIVNFRNIRKNLWKTFHQELCIQLHKAVLMQLNHMEKLHFFRFHWSSLPSKPYFFLMTPFNVW